MQKSSLAIAVCLAFAASSGIAAEPWESPEKDCPRWVERIRQAEVMLTNDLTGSTPAEITKIRADQQRNLDRERAMCNAMHEGDLETARRERLPGPRIGMRAQVVMNRTNWGEPESVNRTITRGGTHEQWVYSGGYLYFENGVLTAIQTRR